MTPSKKTGQPQAQPGEAAAVANPVITYQATPEHLAEIDAKLAAQKRAGRFYHRPSPSEAALGRERFAKQIRATKQAQVSRIVVPVMAPTTALATALQKEGAETPMRPKLPSAEELLQEHEAGISIANLVEKYGSTRGTIDTKLSTARRDRRKPPTAAASTQGTNDLPFERIDAPSAKAESTAQPAAQPAALSLCATCIHGIDRMCPYPQFVQDVYEIPAEDFPEHHRGARIVFGPRRVTECSFHRPMPDSHTAD